MNAEGFMGIGIREGVSRIVAGRASGSRIPRNVSMPLQVWPLNPTQ
jgi:hypothetical protein